MIRLTVAWVMNDIKPEKRWQAWIDESVSSAVARHWHPEHAAFLEHVDMDGKTMLDLPEGRLVMPGHAIETAWMLLEVAQKQNDANLRDTAIEIILSSLELGWDKECGGLRYLLNIDGSPTHPLEADLKLWWPHGEALYALLLAADLTGRADLLEWYERVHEYSFNAFPDREFGEWFGYLNRDGSPVFTAKANGWKGFFHLPRVLFRCVQQLDGKNNE